MCVYCKGQAQHLNFWCVCVCYVFDLYVSTHAIFADRTGDTSNNIHAYAQTCFGTLPAHRFRKKKIVLVCVVYVGLCLESLTHIWVSHSYSRDSHVSQNWLSVALRISPLFQLTSNDIIIIFVSFVCVQIHLLRQFCVYTNWFSRSGWMGRRVGTWWSRTVDVLTRSR